jgi:hypothetical protein
MGKRTELYRSYVSGQAAQARVLDADRRRLTTERNLTMQEQLLGTQAQVGGDLGGLSPEELPFAGRYELDTGYIGGLKAHRAGRYLQMEDFERNMATANKLMDEAQAAARSGDLELAGKLRAQAEAGLGADISGSLVGSSTELLPAFKFIESAEAKAKSRLGSPMAQTVGKLVQQGRSFLDPESAESLRFKRGLTEGAERGIAAASRGARREMRDRGLMRGAARNPYAEAAIAARTEEGFAAQRAQVHQDASMYFEEFSRKFAADTVGFAQGWIQNQGDIRESHLSALDNLSFASAKLSNAAAERSMQSSLATAGHGEGASAGGGGIGSAIGMVAGAVIGTVLLPGIGTALGASLGGAIGGAAGSAISPARGGQAEGGGGYTPFQFDFPQASGTSGPQPNNTGAVDYGEMFGPPASAMGG